MLASVRKSTVDRALRSVTTRWAVTNDGDGLVEQDDLVIRFHAPDTVNWPDLIHAMRVAGLWWRFMFYPGHPQWEQCITVRRDSAIKTR